MSSLSVSGEPVRLLIEGGLLLRTLAVEGGFLELTGVETGLVGVGVVCGGRPDELSEGDFMEPLSLVLEGVDAVFVEGGGRLGSGPGRLYNG